ncbi:MAG: hypothetical protein K8U03_24515 [Planctomycetia bacterium]|nr:hypothetical protein [Planctomycetia bacterium]
MGIRFLCPTCGKRVNVKEQQAGLRGFCPKCGAGIDVPLESTLPSRGAAAGASEPGRAGSGNEGEASQWAMRHSPETSRAAASGMTASGTATPETATIDPLYELPTALWYALPPGAPKPYGPIDGLGLAQWFYEGRLSVDSMVWRQDWPEWREVAAVWPNWSPTGSEPAGEPVIEPPADGSSYPLKAVKAESVVARPPVITSRGTGSAARGLATPVAPTLGAPSKPAAKQPAKPTAQPTAVASAPASAPLSSAAPGAGVYYRRPSNRAYVTTVVVLVLLVLALGGVMIWVLLRTPPPAPPKKGAAAPTTTPRAVTGR